MKLSVYIGVIFSLLLAYVSGVHAQTPTPHPNAIEPALYGFASLASPEIELTGTWVAVGSCLRGEDIGTSATFYIRDAGIVYYTIISTTTSGDVATYNVYLDDVLLYTATTSRGYNGTFRFQLAFENNANLKASFVITTTNNDYLYLCNLEIHPSYQHILNLISSISGTGGGGGDPDPEETPEPYYVYGSVSGTDGDVATRFDMIVTIGDVAIASALLFLLFSGWAFIFIKYLVKPNG